MTTIRHDPPKLSAHDALSALDQAMQRSIQLGRLDEYDLAEVEHAAAVRAMEAELALCTVLQLLHMRIRDASQATR